MTKTVTRRLAAAATGVCLLASGGGLAVAAPDGRPAAAAAAAVVSPSLEGTPTVAGPTGCEHRSGARQVTHGPGGRRVVALTFDDGPAAATAEILRILEREHVPATFFVVGANVAGREALLRRMLDDGHMIANHSYDHVSLAAADDVARQQIEDTQAAVAAATGFTPCLLRPPYGRSGTGLVALAGRAGLTSVLWSVNPRDFLRPGSTMISRRVLAGVRPGSIVLHHDGDGVRGGASRGQTVAALPGIIRGLKARGYRFVTVTDLLGLRTIGDPPP